MLGFVRASRRPSCRNGAGKLNRLDLRNPLVVDTRELGRRPGTMRRASRTVPAPAGLGNPVLGVPEGTDLGLQLRLEAVMEGVLVTGSVRGRVSGECVRCLEPVERSFTADFQELYVYPGLHVEGSDEAETLRLDGDLLDLDQAIRDAVVLALPLAPVCRDGCPGLCPDCGARLAEDPGHWHAVTDPRWAALTGLRDAGSSNETSTDPTEER